MTSPSLTPVENPVESPVDNSAEETINQDAVEQPPADNTEAPETPPAETPVVDTPVVDTPVADPEFFNGVERNPSSWDIKPLQNDGEIEAFNSATRRSFVGTVDEFNRLLRG